MKDGKLTHDLSQSLPNDREVRPEAKPGNGLLPINLVIHIAPAFAILVTLRVPDDVVLDEDEECVPCVLGWHTRKSDQLAEGKSTTEEESRR